MSVTSWFLVSGGGTRHRLPREMIFVGRDDCELMLQSRSVDKQHAVINYELTSDEHKVKDLGSLNGTFVNDVRIQDQTYITLKMEDKLRFGYDTNLFNVVRGEMHVPEEALKHEKFTSQLQLCKTPPNGEAAKTSTKTSKPASAKTPESKAAKPITASPSKAADTHKGDEKTAGDIAALHRGTPLYGQPSWWGDGDADDENSFKQETKTSGKKQENESREGKRAERERERDRGHHQQQAKQPKQNGLAPAPPVGAATADAGYLELPSKDKGMSNSSIHEIPTKDTEGSATAAAAAASANAHHPSGASNASQGHASFTIEFDTVSPGKVTIKDHVGLRGAGRSGGKKSGQAGLVTLQAAMMASETKVADWLAQNDPPMVRRESTEEDSKTIKSDVPVHFRRLKGSKHEDGTQSDSENGLGHHRLGSSRHRQQQQQAALEERLRAVAASASSSASARSKAGSGDGQSPSSSSRTAFMIEFYDEANPRKRRSYSFSQTAPLLPGVGEGGPTSAVSTEHLSPAPPPTRPSHKAGSTGGGGIAIGMATEGGAKAGSGSSPSPLALVAPTAARLLQKQREEQQQLQQQQQMGVSGNVSSTRSSAPTGKSASPTEESHKQDGDDHSDKGTYTIELENRNPEEEEARRMIDKVFGLEAGQNRPKGGPQKPEGKASDSKKPSSKTAEVIIDEQVAVGSPHWVSQWASHAANHTRTDPEGSGAEPSAFVHQEREAEAFDSTLSQRSGSTPSSLTQERKRRTLPQLPADDKAKLGSKAALGALGLGLGLRSEIGEKQDTEPQEKENHNGGGGESGHKGNGHSLVEGKPVGIVKANGVATAVLSEGKEGGRRRRGGGGAGSGQEGRGSGSDTGEKSGGRPLVRQGSFTIDRPSGAVPTELIPIIGRGDGSGVAPTATKGRERSDSTGSMDTATLLKDTEAVMAFLEAKLRDEGVRQDKRGGGSNTISAASSSSLSKSQRHRGGGGGGGGSISPESDVDTNSTVSQTAAEAERAAAKAMQPVKRRSLSSLHREKSNASTTSVVARGGGTSSTTAANAALARDRLDKKSKSRTTTSGQAASTRGRQPSLDLTDDDLTSSHPLSTMSDVLSSDQDTPSSRSYGGRGGHFASTEDLVLHKASSSTSLHHIRGSSSRVSKTSLHASTGSLATTKSTQQQQQSGAGALPTPRPTRASLLRRARLGDTSDNDLADADRVSVASEVSTTSSTSRPPSGRKAPSRIDMLAQPRRTRLGSISARSDSEATVGVRSTASRVSAETALRLGLRQPSGHGGLTAKNRSSSISKLTEVKTKVTPPTHGSPSEDPDPDAETSSVPTDDTMVGTRWRRLAPEYASTSEDEFGSSRTAASKHGRPLRGPPALRTSRLGSGGSSAPPTPGAGAGGMLLKHRGGREHDEYIRDWTAHSEEIARISQDLAKDLAILAREIHDVAGEIDSVSSSGTAPSTTVSTAATTPGSAIDTREETKGEVSASSIFQLVDRVFDESLNFRKIPPVIHSKAPEVNGRPVELRPRAPDSLDTQKGLRDRRRTWNREDAVLDSLLLHSVSQLSGKIRQSVDKTAAKIRILFKDKDRNWDDIESKLRAESDIPLLKTTNKEISSILLELKRVEKQLQVINVMVDPDGTLDALTSLGLTSPTMTKPRISPTSSQTPPAPLPGPGATKAPSGATSPGDCQRELGLSFARALPSGEEAAAVASK